MELITKNLTVTEEVAWETILSMHLCVNANKYKFLMELGFSWSSVMSLKLDESPETDARVVIIYLIDDLTKAQRDLLLARIKKIKLPDWITGATTLN